MCCIIWLGSACETAKFISEIVFFVVLCEESIWHKGLSETHFCRSTVGGVSRGESDQQLYIESEECVSFCFFTPVRVWNFGLYDWAHWYVCVCTLVYVYLYLYSILGFVCWIAMCLCVFAFCLHSKLSKSSLQTHTVINNAIINT